MSKVFFSPTDKTNEVSLTSRVESLWRAADLESVLENNALTALKLHVGEPGNVTHVAPEIAGALVHCIRRSGGVPFLTDTAVLYKSPRDNGVGHSRVASEHGFGIEAIGAPFIPADGLLGDDEIELDVPTQKKKTHFKSVAIASAIIKARSMIVLSHATGHIGTGLGGALKNLGMGCASKKAKLRQHYGQIPLINPKLCTACGTCEGMCPSEAISIPEDAALIDVSKCIGCGECIVVCRDGAVEFDWTIMGAELQERIVEHASAVYRKKPNRIGYITVAENITKDCDCFDAAQRPLIEDIGILASTDPVAIDSAVLDLIKKRNGRQLTDMTYPKIDASSQVRYAKKMGMGSGEYEIVTVPS